MASLLIVKGANQGKHLPMEQDRLVLGRNPDCDIVISGANVSRQHAQIVKIEGEYYIEDRQSRNGTFVNDQQIRGRTLLQDSDRIRICDFLATFQDVAHARRPEPLPDKGSITQFGGDAGPVPEPSAGVGQKLDALLGLGNRLARTTDVNEALRLTLDCLFDVFRPAARGFVLMPEAEGGRLAPRRVRARRPQDEAKAGFSRRVLDACLAAGEPIVAEDAATDTRFAPSASIATYGIVSVMCASLRGLDGRAFGALMLDTQDPGKRFAPEDLRFLTGVANLLSRALEAVQVQEDLLARERLRYDLELARQVQRGFRPRRLPAVPGYDLFLQTEPAQAARGDFHDLIPLLPNRLAVVLGDAPGTGASAAVLGARVVAVARSCLRTEPDLATAVRRLNEQIIREGLTDRFVTLLAAVLDVGSSTVLLTSAGGPQALVYRRATGGVEDAVEAGKAGPPLGIVEEFAYETCPIRLDPGDSVLFFSDGISETLRPQRDLFQLRRTVQALANEPASAGRLGERVMQAYRRHKVACGQPDDVTLICFGRTPG